MSNVFEILNPERSLQTASGRIICVHELSWRTRRQVIDDVIARVAEVQQLRAEAFSIGDVAKWIGEADDIIERVLRETTGLTKEGIGDLTATEVFALLDAAVDLNITAYKDGAKKTFGRITTSGATAAFPMTQTTPSPSASNS